MATYSSTLAWKIPWTEEPGRLQSMGSLRVGHDWSNLAAAAAAASRTVSAENACVLLRVPICADTLQPQGVNPLVISWTDSSGLLESREGKGFPLPYSGLENSLNYTVGLQRVGHDWVTFTFALESAASSSPSSQQEHPKHKQTFLLLIRIDLHGVTALLKAFQLPGKECDGGILKLHPAPRWAGHPSFHTSFIH